LKGLKQAMLTLRDNFRRADEKPLEQMQTVQPFDLCSVPITNEVYALFSSAHIEDARSRIVEEQDSHARGYEADGKQIQMGEGDHKHTGWDRAERPAIHITWFDAWVFAQWARWRESDATYRCRLPHEPEWEFACKRTPLEGGASTESPFGQRYWWGNDFYERPKDPVEESISNRCAHAFGWPGATRPPASAKPNGYGLKDMIGNVWEWCANIYDERSEAEIKADSQNTGYSRFRPTAAQRYDAPRVIRGGLWWYLNHISTASSRFRLEPSDGDYKTGFRLVRERVAP
jgi:formylglycine-generating enzyme required for sulfatase activity